MAALSRPVSSPARADNYPPPLLRFLRSGAGSKNRKPARRSPVFRLRGGRRSSAAPEPSSPKVTCTGQVRESGGRRRRRRCWLSEKSKALFSKFQERIFSWWGFLKGERAENSVQDCNDENALNGPFPPQLENAVMLTRCRSAPYRSSSLGGLIWGSSLIEEKGKFGIENGEKLENPSWKNLRIGEENCGMKLEDLVSDFQGIKVNGGCGGAVHPLLLTRCRSEPARRRFSS
ncbi:protamine P1 family protein [Striga asiatica]|uniref:Protamine P1 family protein n=1 Tax=Striga asiatica TaxID=4170 RepID=A0A5A7RJF7_STRAF|nr:protamine P1 family protein [Striga asiatica]